MGTYYFLINETKNERVHYDHHIKWSMTNNSAVCEALIKYQLEHLGDDMAFMSDYSDDVYDSKYKEVALKEAKP